MSTFDETYNKVFKGRVVDTSLMADCEALWRAAVSAGFKQALDAVPKKNFINVGAHVLATELGEAVRKDEAEDGLDMSGGLFGTYTSAWLRHVAVTYLSASGAIWQPMVTVPKEGTFLIGVWEGEWENPRKDFHVYEAIGYPTRQVWGRSYRTEEGESYTVVGWMPKPDAP